MEKLEGKSFNSIIDTLSEADKEKINYEMGIYNKQLNSICGERFGYFGQPDKQGENWILAHNGTIFNNYLPLNTYKKIQKGTTDSERILYYIIDNINKENQKTKKPLTNKEKFNIINTIISEIAPENKLNLLIYNNNITYIHTNFKNSLHYLKKDNSIIISTVPLTMENWKKVPLNTLIALKNGKIINQGEPHPNEYIESQSDLNFLNNCVPQIFLKK